MRVNPYIRELLTVIVTLANARPADMDAVTRAWTAAGMPVENPASSADLETVTAFLDTWERLADAEEPTARAAILNEMLARHVSAPTVTDHDGTGWHLHNRSDDASLGAVLAASGTIATAEHLTRAGMHRIGRCALPECTRVYADASRPGTQRYCSHACANRDAVRRHRRTRATD